MIRWRKMIGFPDYKVSSVGEIKSFKRYSKGRLLKPYTDKDGYNCVSLQLNGQSKAEKVHRAVAKAFIPNPDKKEQINHKNGIKRDNRFENLEWCNNLHNQRHAWDNDFKTIKLTTKCVKDIKRRLMNQETNTSIAKIYGVDQTLISNIKTGKIWKRIHPDSEES